MSYNLLDLIHESVKPSEDGTGVELALDIDERVQAHVFKKAADYLDVESEEFVRAHSMNFENDPEYVQGFHNGLLHASRCLRMQAGEIT